MLLPSVALADSDNPWQPRVPCYFGMPYMGHAVMLGGKGVFVDILKAVYEPEKIDLIHKALPYGRAVQGVENGTIHCTIDVEPRHKKLQAKYVPAIYDLSVAYMRSIDFKGVKSLEGKRIAYVHGFGLKDFIPVKVKTQLVYDLSSGFHMLERGNVSFVLGEDRLLKAAMYDSKIPAGIFAVTPLREFNTKVIFAPTEEGRRFRDIYDRRMKEMMKSGEFRRIMESYGSSDKEIQRVLDANARN